MRSDAVSAVPFEIVDLLSRWLHVSRCELLYLYDFFLFWREGLRKIYRCVQRRLTYLLCILIRRIVCAVFALEMLCRIGMREGISRMGNRKI